MTTSDGSTASYYELPEGATELQHLISHRDMNSQIGEVFRACYRYGQASHSDKLRDAKKIRFYAQAEIERLEKLEMAKLVCGTHLDFDESRIDIVAASGGQGEHYAEDMTDPANWRAGDLVECLEWDGVYFTPGEIYPITESRELVAEGGIEFKLHVCTGSGVFRFHSRPSQVNEKEMSGAWIVWNGVGEPDCDGLSRIEAGFRDGETEQGEAGGFRWNHDGTDGDIIRFRML